MIVLPKSTRQISLKPCAKRIRAIFNGRTVVDTLQAQYLYEGFYPPVWYFRREDVDFSILTASDHTTHCPFKGDANYWSVSVAGKIAENAIWAYPDPVSNLPELKGLVAFYWNRMDHWFEEDEEVFVHPRDPNVRVDVLASARTVRIEHEGDVLAESDEALFMFETRQMVRYYLPRNDIFKPLTLSDTKTACPYKGIATYWDIASSSGTITDAVWTYSDPPQESAAIAGYDCFFNEKFDIFIDDQKQECQVPKWNPQQ